MSRTHLLATCLLTGCMAPTLTHLGTDAMPLSGPAGTIEAGASLGGGVAVGEASSLSPWGGGDVHLRVGLGKTSSFTVRGFGSVPGLGNLRLGAEHAVVFEGASLSGFYGVGATIGSGLSFGGDAGLALSVPMAPRTRFFIGAAANPLRYDDSFGVYTVAGLGVSHLGRPGTRRRSALFRTELVAHVPVVQDASESGFGSVGVLFSLSSTRRD
jgi:hypothetical protein